MSNAIQVDLSSLTTREKAAYKHSIDRKEPFLSPILADQLYALFESGKSCEEIQELNKSLSLGTIVRARMDFGWEERRQNHFDSLRDRARINAQQLTLESVSFLGDLLNAFHKHDKGLFQRFIQTGNLEELKDAVMMAPGSLRTYQSVVELLMKLTGQESTKTQNVNVHHITEQPIPAAARPLSPEEAAAILAGMGKK